VRLCWFLAFALAGAACAQDDFTDIPDFPDTPAPSPSATVPPPVPFTAKPLTPTTPLIPVGNTAKLIAEYEEIRLKAFTDRVLTVTVCGQNMWGGDSRRSHAILARGDEWLARSDAIWRDALRTGEGDRMRQALRYQKFAHDDYKAARYPPRDFRHEWRDSPPPRPIVEARPPDVHQGSPGMGTRFEPVEEPVIWNRYDQIPLE
jgi:hypothetical protein